MKIATLFSGGEGVGVGAKMAGLSHLWGIEYDNDIAQVARDNGFNTITANVLDVDPVTMPRPDVLHASPVCTRASVANANATEAQIDIDTANATARFIDVLKPDYFTLENVYPYRKFEAFSIICDALSRNGYWWTYQHLNSADFGVPQTRRRLVLWASRVGLLPMMPPPVEWVGWYEAIEDLIPSLPESQFAPWQLARLPEGVNGSIAMQVQGECGDGILCKREPMQTITTAHGTNKYRAFILDGKLNDNSTSLTSRDGHKPFMTVTTSHNNRDVKAWLSSGRVVKMTPRALARFQSFPDWYKLPAKNSLAVKVVGNAVPPLMYQRIAEALIR